MFPIGLCGALMVIVAAWGLDSPVHQAFSLFLKENYVRLALIGLGLLLHGISLFGRVLREAAPEGRTHSHADADALGRKRRRRPGVWFSRVTGAAIVLLGIALFGIMVQRLIKQPSGLKGPAMFLSALGMVLVGLAQMESGRVRSWWRDLGFLARRRPPARWWMRDAPWLAAFLLLWILGMLWRLDTRPGFFHGDEATAVQYGHSTYQDPDVRKCSSPWTTQYQNYLSGVPRAFLCDNGLKDRPYWGPRLYSVLLGAFALGTLFLLVRRVLGRFAAWLALVLTASNHVYIAFSRSAILNIDGVWMLTIWALAWVAGWRSLRPSMGFVSGTASALGYYTYHGALLGIPVSLTLLAIEFVRNPKRVLTRWFVVAAFAVGAAAGVTPIHVFYRNNPQGLHFRTEGVSLLSERNLNDHLQRYKVGSVPAVLLRHSWPAVGGVLLWPDTSSNYGYLGRPSVDRASLALFLLGLVGAAFLIHRRRALALLALWWGLGIFLSSVLTAAPDPPYLARSLMTLPPLFTLAAWTLSLLIRRAKRRWPGWRSAAVAVAVLALAGQIAAVSAYHYFGIYARDLKNSYYRYAPMAMMEFLRKFPKDAHLVYYCDHYNQMYTAFLKMYDTGFTRDLFVRPEDTVETSTVAGVPRNADFAGPLPPPSRQADRVAYVLKMPTFQKIDEKLAKAYPAVKPIDLKNPYIKDDPVFYRVYWIEVDRKAGGS